MTFEEAAGAYLSRLSSLEYLTSAAAAAAAAAAFFGDGIKLAETWPIWN